MTFALPWPPADLAAKSLPLHIVPAGSQLLRFHAKEHGPLYFNRSAGWRWNAPDGSFGVCYVGLELAAAFAETFVREPSATYLDLAALRAKVLTRLRAGRDLRLVEMKDSGLKRAGATSLVCSHLPYDLPQAWAKALHGHPDAPDGIVYRASHDDGTLCAAIFDKAGNAVEDDGGREDVESAPWLFGMALRYGLGLPPGG